MQPKVSVIIPVYNVEAYLRQCLDSVLAQTLREIEVICIDDGSTDACPEILADYAARDSRVRVLTQQNLYAGVARNRGISEAKGKYLSFLDSDDFFEPDMLEREYVRCEETGADICLCGADNFDQRTGEIQSSDGFLPRRYIGSGVISRRTLKNDILKITLPNPWTKLFRADFVRKYALHYQSFQRTNDLYFVMTAIALADRIVSVDAPLVHYRIGQTGNLQSGNTKTPTLICQALAAMKDTLEHFGVYREIRLGFAEFALFNIEYTFRRMRSSPMSQYVLAAAMRDTYISALGLDDSRLVRQLPETYQELLPECIRYADLFEKNPAPGETCLPEEYGRRLSVITPDSGVTIGEDTEIVTADSWAEGLARARGEYVVFLRRGGAVPNADLSGFSGDMILVTDAIAPGDREGQETFVRIREAGRPLPEMAGQIFRTDLLRSRGIVPGEEAPVLTLLQALLYAGTVRVAAGEVPASARQDPVTTLWGLHQTDTHLAQIMAVCPEFCDGTFLAHIRMYREELEEAIAGLSRDVDTDALAFFTGSRGEEGKTLLARVQRCRSAGYRAAKATRWLPRKYAAARRYLREMGMKQTALRALHHLWIRE